MPDLSDDDLVEHDLDVRREVLSYLLRRASLDLYHARHAYLAEYRVQGRLRVPGFAVRTYVRAHAVREFIATEYMAALPIAVWR